MKVQIEQGIDMAPPQIGRPLKYPWLEMNVGDSFVMQTYDGYSRALAASKKYAPKVFKARKIKLGTVRIWRVE